ncbi:MAG: PAS domain S-box protein [Candidatus Saganbacteria bacterium]|nr:PAS domain S-box protein [Candidatus Saganbacteria bacterium]
MVNRTAELEAQIHKLLQVVEQSPSTVLITDTEGNIDYVNPHFCELTGYAAEEVVGQNIRMLKLGDQPPEVYKALWDTITAGKKWHGRFHNKKKNGQHYWENVCIGPLRDDSGKTIYYIKVAEEITKEVELEKLRDDLTHMIVHDLKNPLTGIVSAVELLRSGTLGPLTQDQAKFLDAARISYKKLSNLIMDLLEIKKMEDNKLQLHITQFSAKELLDSLDWTTKLAQKDQKTVKFKADPKLVIKADQNLLTRILENLITNAVKHTDQGGKIDVLIEQKDNDFYFEIADTGEGIPKEYLDKVFERFFKVSGAKMTTKIDTGLGLTFCKMAVEAHGGRIGVKSEPGSGSIFYFNLPNT